MMGSGSWRDDPVVRPNKCNGPAECTLTILLQVEWWLHAEGIKALCACSQWGAIVSPTDKMARAAVRRAALRLRALPCILSGICMSEQTALHCTHYFGVWTQRSVSCR